MAHHTVRFTIPHNLPAHHVGVNGISDNSAVGYKSQGRKDERSFRSYEGLEVCKGQPRSIVLGSAAVKKAS